MKFSAEQLRTLVALACKIAWADGVVTEEERDYVRGLAQRFAGAVISDEEVDSWLDSGAPEAEISSLPEGLGELFFYEAMKISEVDGEIADTEIEMLNDIMSRVFAHHSGEATLARIVMANRKLRSDRNTDA